MTSRDSANAEITYDIAPDPLPDEKTKEGPKPPAVKKKKTAAGRKK